MRLLVQRLLKKVIQKKRIALSIIFFCIFLVVNVIQKPPVLNSEGGTAAVAVATVTTTITESKSPITTIGGKPQQFPVCRNNPYVSALKDSLEVISQRAQVWLNSSSAIALANLRKNPRTHRWNHRRFDAFEIMAPCNATSCVGGPCKSDESKIVCGLDSLQTTTDKNEDELCIIYSIGGNNRWQFEESMLESTKCIIHTFDCTGNIERFNLKPPNPRVHFHHVCLGTSYEQASKKKRCNAKSDKCGETWTLQQIQQRLNHKRIDLFKMDIEGFEWPLFESWPELADTTTTAAANNTPIILPRQVLVEVHYRTQFKALSPNRSHHFKNLDDMFQLQTHLLKTGYVVVERDNNRACRHCTELTLLLAHCED